MQPAAPPDPARLKRWVTILSVAIAAVMVAMKLVVWLASGSVALLASAADSALDLVTSAATFFAVRYAAEPPDAEHRYGHGKAEAFASLLQAGLVFASASLIAEEAIRHILRPTPVRQEGSAILVMVVSTALTLLLVLAQSYVLRRSQSVAISADRAHYFADLASNLVALAGIAGTALIGWSGLDAGAGLFVGALLLWGAISVFRRASDQLMDHELPEADRQAIRALVLRDPKITDLHQLRTRASGPVIHLQMHATLDPEITLDAAHKVIVSAERRILETFPTADIIIHPDPKGRAEPHGGAFAETAQPLDPEGVAARSG